jgi:hypothetical protein
VRVRWRSSAPLVLSSLLRCSHGFLLGVAVLDAGNSGTDEVIVIKNATQAASRKQIEASGFQQPTTLIELELSGLFSGTS